MKWKFIRCHSGAPRSGEPGIHTHRQRLWIPGSLAAHPSRLQPTWAQIYADLGQARDRWPRDDGGGCRGLERRLAAAAVVLVAMLMAGPLARAQDYPSRPVKIIVPFPAGGTADVMPRIFSEWLAKKWGQPVVIENRTGAAGNIGAEAVAKADPDGYTLLAAPAPPLVINQNLYPRLGFDPTEFVPIVIMGRVPNALVLNARVPLASVADVIAYAKANPGKLTCA